MVDSTAWRTPGLFTAWRNRDLDRNRNRNGNSKVERSRTILRAAGTTGLPKLFDGWARFLGVSSTGVHLGAGLDSARKYSLVAEPLTGT